jgi:uncharacterized protein (TIGR02147 family)
MSAFARDLDLSQPFLLQILTGKRKLSDEKALRVSLKLRWTQNQKNIFVHLVRFENTKDALVKQILSNEIIKLEKKQPKSHQLTEDIFTFIADWYYYAILELTTIKGFKSDIHWISKKLNVPEVDIKVAIERLKRLGMLEDICGKLSKTKEDYSFKDIPSKALKRHHQQSLQLASKAIDQQNLEEREFSSITLAMDPQQIKMAKTKIQEFYNELMKEMEQTDKRAVYKMSIQLFRLDRKDL